MRTCGTCDAPLWPVTELDGEWVRACPYCDRVDMMPRVNGTAIRPPYDWDAEGSA